MSNNDSNFNINLNEVVNIMAENNPEAREITLHLISNVSDIMDIVLCNSLNIRGDRLSKLFSDCCNNNYNKLSRTLMMIANHIFTEKEINENLNLDKAIPFIDDSIVIDGVPRYGELFSPGYDKWIEYCFKNKMAFSERLKKHYQRCR